MSANLQTDSSSPASDRIKWLIAVALLVGAIVGFYYWSEESLLLRVIGLLLLIALAVLVAVQTESGRSAWYFVIDARTELRKVVWPNRKETVQTTMIILAMVTAVAIILWGLDSFFAWSVKLLLGTGP